MQDPPFLPLFLSKSLRKYSIEVDCIETFACRIWVAFRPATHHADFQILGIQDSNYTVKGRNQIDPWRISCNFVHPKFTGKIHEC
jgi:hypothetical protein